MTLTKEIEKRMQGIEKWKEYEKEGVISPRLAKEKIEELKDYSSIIIGDREGKQ